MATGPKFYADLADLPEDERIHIIGQSAADGKVVGFFTDDDAKADRYIAKLTKWYPTVRVIDRKRDVLVPSTVFVRVGPKGH